MFCWILFFNVVLKNYLMESDDFLKNKWGLDENKKKGALECLNIYFAQHLLADFHVSQPWKWFHQNKQHAAVHKQNLHHLTHFSDKYKWVNSPSLSDRSKQQMSPPCDSGVGAHNVLLSSFRSTFIFCFSMTASSSVARLASWSEKKQIEILIILFLHKHLHVPEFED